MRWWVLIGVAVTFVGLAGCHGMVKTYDDRMNMYSQVLETDARQLVDDWDTFWLADRQYRLTEWYLR
jgi:hypothetical protein